MCASLLASLVVDALVSRENADIRPYIVENTYEESWHPGGGHAIRFFFGGTK